MAEAVNNAAVVCCFMTPEYENSRNCKLELQHAQKLGKRIIPCMVSDRKVWKPSPAKWLDFITGSIIAIDFSDPSETGVKRKTNELIGLLQKPSLAALSTTSSTPMKYFETIKNRYLEKNRIHRTVNEERSFPIEESYINLSLVETEEQQKKERKLKQHGENRLLHEHEHEQSDLGKQNQNEILGTFEEIYSVKTVIDVKKLFEKCKKPIKAVLVLGRAGIGKSTFCQYVTYRWAKNELWPQYELVILIRLRSLIDTRHPSKKKYALIDLVEVEYFPDVDLSDEAKLAFQAKCDKGRVLWVLDGYDEFAQNISSTLKDVFNHIRETQHHILTSRPYAIALSYDVQLEITGFTNENITKYVQQFFKQTEDRMSIAVSQGQKLLTFLRSNRNIWGIAHIPVNLELIASLWTEHDWSGNKSFTMTSLYDNIVEWLCRRYLTRKSIDHEHMTRQMVCKQCTVELQFLEQLAFEAMEANRIIISPTMLEEIETVTDFSLADHPQLLNLGILKCYDNNPLGSKNPTQKQHYFVHLSFQEHFAARHLLRMLDYSETKQRAKTFIQTYKYNQRFHMMFLFTSGLLGYPSYKSCEKIFWSILEDEPRDLIHLRHAQLIIASLNEIGGHALFPDCARYLNTVFSVIERYANKKEAIITRRILIDIGASLNLLNKTITQEKLVKLIDSKTTTIRHQILETLAIYSVSQPTARLLSGVLDALRDPDKEARRAAFRALGNLVEKAPTSEVIAALVNALGDHDEDVRCVACEALQKMDDNDATSEVITALANALGDDYASVRQEACNVLQNLGQKAATPEVITALANAVGDHDEDVRRSACRALEKMGQKAATPEVITALANAVGDHDEDVRRSACRALEKMGQKAATPEVITALANAVGDHDEDVRRSACRALEKTESSDA